MEYFMKIEMKPVPKGRPRFFNRGKFVTVYTPEKTLKAEKYIAQCWKEKFGDRKLEGALSMECFFMFKKPKSWSKKKKLEVLHKTSKPDLTNLVKTVEDGLNEVAYKDDSQLIFINSGKYYGESDYVSVTLREIDNKSFAE